MTRALYNVLQRGAVLAGRYTVDAPLGRGRSAVVYGGRDQRNGQTVALKVLDPSLAADPVATERFRREMTALAQLAHPHVVRVFDYVVEGNLRVIVMEPFGGMNGKELVKRRGRLAVDVVIQLARAMGSALDACHKAGVLHRDVKPHNVLIDDRFALKLADFGVAKITSMSDLTRTGTVVGTPEYMAPEMFHSGRGDVRADVYGLAATIYEWLSGRPPLVAPSIAQIVGRKFGSTVEQLVTLRADVPEWLDAVIQKGLAVDPCKRQQSIYEFLHDLDMGPRALAHRERQQAEVPCRKCRTPVLPGLAFCHACGTFADATITKGRTTLVLNAVTNADEALAHLVRAFPDTNPRRLSAAIRRPPVALAAGLSSTSAGALASELFEYGCVLQLSEGLEDEFRLPNWLLPFAAIPSVTLAATQSGAWQALGAVFGAVLGALAVLLIYREKTRPLLVLERAAGAEPAHLKLQRWAAREMMALQDPALRRVLAAAVLSAARILRLGMAQRAKVDAETLTRALAKVFTLAREAERHERFLGSRTLNELRARLDILDLQLRRMNEPAAPAVEQRAALRAELAHYQEVQDQHAAAMLAVLNFRSLLARLEDRLAAGDAAELALLGAWTREVGP